MADEADAIVLRLLSERAADATICPSEAARLLARSGAEDAADPGSDWRAKMPRVHAAVDRLVAARAVRLSWKGAARDRRDGPYRIARLC